MKKKITPITIAHAQHEPSEHVVRLGITEQKIRQKKQSPASINWLLPFLFWIDHIAFLSLIGFLVWIASVIVEKVFRVQLPINILRERIQSSYLLYTSLSSLPAIPATSKNEQASTVLVGSTKKILTSKPTSKQKRKQGKQVSPVLPTFGIFTAPTESAVGFAMVAALLVGSIWTVDLVGNSKYARAAIVAESVQAVEQIFVASEAIAQNDLEAAGNNFHEALRHFDAAREPITAIPSVLKELSQITKTGKNIAIVESVLDAAERVTEASLILTRALERLGENALQQNSYEEILLLSNTDAAQAVWLLQSAQTILRSIRTDHLSQQLTSVLSKAQYISDRSLQNLAEQIELFTGIAPTLLGFHQEQRYLVFFQNSNELRATGGFLGSYALVDVVNGELRNIEIPGGGTYDLQGSLRARLQAPEPLQLINERFELQDANWWVDWPTSAKKLQHLYEQAGGSSVDGVVVIDNKFVEALLAVVGPITVPGYENKEITSDNFTRETQFEVEERYDKTQNKPKQFIADLAPLLLERIFSSASNQRGAFFQATHKAFAERHIMIYHNDQDMNEALALLGWNGALRTLPPRTDVVAVVHTNIAGQKTDGVIENSVSHEVHVDTHGQAIVTLQISRMHTGKKGEPFTGVRNVNYLRTYVPKGSVLLESDGWSPPDKKLFKQPDASLLLDVDLLAERSSFLAPATDTRIYEEFGYTVFANWMMVDPGEKTTVTLRYILPWKLKQSTHYPTGDWLAHLSAQHPLEKYRLYVHKQPGIDKTSFSHRTVFADEVHVLHGSPNIEAHKQGWQSANTLTTDAYYGMHYY